MSRLSKFLRDQGWLTSKPVPPPPPLTGLTTVALADIAPFEFRMHVDKDDRFISAPIEREGTYEPLETEVIRRLLPTFRTFIDIGANIGWYSAIAARRMAAGSRVIAFEPEPANFALLKTNVPSGEAVAADLEQVAVSNRPGRLELHLSDTNPGDHRLYASEPGRKVVEVPVITLGDYFKGRTLGPSLIKCDTQGSEPRILPDAGRLLGDALGASVFLFEFWPNGMQIAGDSVMAFIDTLAAWPHTGYVLDSRARLLRPLDWNELKRRCGDDLGPETDAYIDLLLIGREAGAAQTVLTDLFAPASGNRR